MFEYSLCFSTESGGWVVWNLFLRSQRSGTFHYFEWAKRFVPVDKKAVFVSYKKWVADKYTPGNWSNVWTINFPVLTTIPTCPIPKWLFVPKDMRRFESPRVALTDRQHKTADLNQNTIYGDKMEEDVGSTSASSLKLNLSSSPPKPGLSSPGVDRRSSLNDFKMENGVLSPRPNDLHTRSTSPRLNEINAIINGSHVSSRLDDSPTNAKNDGNEGNFAFFSWSLLFFFELTSFYVISCMSYLVFDQRRSQGARGAATPPPMMKSWCSRNPQICNMIDTLEGSIEMASTTALFYLEKDVSLCPKGCFPNIWRVQLQKFSRGLCHLTPIILSFFTSYSTSTLAMTRGYRALSLAMSIVTFQALHPFWLPSSCPHPFVPSSPPMAIPLLSPKDATLATSQISSMLKKIFLY